ncbi:kinesin-domain-containing protein [Linderina pennispora]|uniref:Kinesin-like protein n=1 Tax=Linderina pennispora TaxID=61395 RepID=A0A1Y1WDG3_9FUNG|nr:kinesin-domain-containing protein [Linderina pennispora]ORX71425.1 kinesin-domain-containing protein [Linderina pennispora]
MGQYSARPSFDAVGESPTAGGFSDAATDASSANGANVQGSTNGSVSDVDDGEKVLPPRTYNFDFVYGPETSQISVFDSSIAPLLARFVEGYNVTILAYGQTSSGKTFTMGTDADATAPEDVGIVPRALTQIFQWTNSHQTVDETGKPNIDVRVSFMEVYNEELIDLVAQSQFHGVRPPIFIREDTKGNVVWVGVKEQAVSDAQHALSILIDGSKERQTGGTRMNDKSSRSHAIYTVTLTQQRTRGDSHEPVKIVSKLHFVDLAGSERLKKTQAEGERQREGISINSGLLALGNVISALGSPQRGADLHVPYRNSKLTYMLRDSLGGKANMAETVNTLKYAARARNIKNRGGVNMDATASR